MRARVCVCACVCVEWYACVFVGGRGMWYVICACVHVGDVRALASHVRRKGCVGKPLNGRDSASMLRDCGPEIVEANTEGAEDASARDEDTLAHCRCRPSRELRLSREQRADP